MKSLLFFCCAVSLLGCSTGLTSTRCDDVVNTLGTVGKIICEFTAVQSAAQSLTVDQADSVKASLLLSTVESAREMLLTKAAIHSDISLTVDQVNCLSQSIVELDSLANYLSGKIHRKV